MDLKIGTEQTLKRVAELGGSLEHEIVGTQVARPGQQIRVVGAREFGIERGAEIKRKPKEKVW